jgi:hypothetical protein
MASPAATGEGEACGPLVGAADGAAVADAVGVGEGDGELAGPAVGEPTHAASKDARAIAAMGFFMVMGCS